MIILKRLNPEPLAQVGDIFTCDNMLVFECTIYQVGIPICDVPLLYTANNRIRQDITFAPKPLHLIAYKSHQIDCAGIKGTSRGLNG